VKPLLFYVEEVLLRVCWETLVSNETSSAAKLRNFWYYMDHCGTQSQF
jgi:hypothetical protein